MSVCPITGTVYLHDAYAKQSSCVRQEPYDWDGLECSLVYYEGATPQIIIDSPLLAAVEPEIFFMDDMPVPLSPPQEVISGPDVHSIPETFDSYQPCYGIEQGNSWTLSNTSLDDLKTACADNSCGLATVPYLEPELYPAHFQSVDNYPSPQRYGYVENDCAYQAVEPPFDIEGTAQYLSPPPTTIPGDEIKNIHPWERFGECCWANCGRSVKADKSDMSKHLKEFHHPDLRKLGPDSRVKCLWDGCKRKRAFPMNMARHCVSAKNHLIDQRLCDFCRNATFSSLEGFYEHLSVCSFSPLYRTKVTSRRRRYKNPELAQRSPTFVMVQQNRGMKTVK